LHAHCHGCPGYRTQSGPVRLVLLILNRNMERPNHQGPIYRRATALGLRHHISLCTLNCGSSCTLSCGLRQQGQQRFCEQGNIEGFQLACTAVRLTLQAWNVQGYNHASERVQLNGRSKWRLQSEDNNHSQHNHHPTRRDYAPCQTLSAFDDVLHCDEVPVQFAQCFAFDALNSIDELPILDRVRTHIHLAAVPCPSRCKALFIRRRRRSKSRFTIPKRTSEEHPR
jgi:hypothetical protein